MQTTVINGITRSTFNDLRHCLPHADEICAAEHRPRPFPMLVKLYALGALGACAVAEESLLRWAMPGTSLQSGRAGEITIMATNVGASAVTTAHLAQPISRFARSVLIASRSETFVRPSVPARSVPQHIAS